MANEGARGNSFFAPELAELGHSFDPSSFYPAVGTNVAEPFAFAVEQTVMILLERAGASLIIATKQNWNGSGRRSARGRRGCLKMTIQSTAF